MSTSSGQAHTTLSLKGRTALVTGSASGLGKRIAEFCAAAGARVVFTTVDDIAQAALTFAAWPGNALTGQSLVVSHGWFMQQVAAFCSTRQKNVTVNEDRFQRRPSR